MNDFIELNMLKYVNGNSIIKYSSLSVVSLAVGGGVEPGRQGLGAVPAGHQLLAHHLAVLPPPPRPAARLGAPGAQIFLLGISCYLNS